MSVLERRLAQRSALAEFALRALGAEGPVALTEAAARASSAGLGCPHAAVFRKRSYGLELVASAGWPTGADAPAGAFPALTRTDAVAFAGAGPLAHGVAARVDGGTPYLLVAAAPEALGLDEDDRDFFRDVGAVLHGAFERAELEAGLRDSEARARSSEARAHAVLDTTVDGIVTIDERGRIQSFNHAAEAIFGYRAAEVHGENVSVLMPEPHRHLHDGYLRHYLETGQRNIIGIGREVIGRRRDGSTFPMDLAVSEVVVPGVRLFTGIVRDITERRALEREVVHGIEHERQQIARDLHDELGQELTGIHLLAGDLARRLEGREREDAREIAALVGVADDKARGIARGLVMTDVGQSELGAAVAAMVRRAGRLLGVRATFEASGAAGPVAAATATHLYRIAQEAFTNAARHANPTRIQVRLDWEEDALALSVLDDGDGIPGLTRGTLLPAPQRVRDRPGLGIQTMVYRARLLGGTLTLAPVEGGGTAVVCHVPRAYVPPDDLGLARASGDVPAAPEADVLEAGAPEAPGGAPAEP